MSALFPTNEHFVERFFRIVIGLILTVSAVVGAIPLWGLIGIVPLFTGIVGFCPLYTLFGVSTCPLTRKS